MIYNKLKLRKNEKGITLLALIVTLIIMLILAGVSIAVLVGENGIIDNAVKSKKATEAASAKERAGLAVMAAKIDSKKNNINLSTVKAELEENGLIIDGEGDSFPLTVTDGINKYKISENGTIKTVEKVTAAEIAANKEKYYGQAVSNYTAGGRTYRIFYVDEAGDFGEANTIYLKADWTEDDVSLNLEESDIYTPISTEILELMNPIWFAERAQATWNENEKRTAYLCDPTTANSGSNQTWANYFDGKKANYAIGSPSIEMFIKSYNQVPHTLGNYTLGVSYSNRVNPGYIYTLNGNRSSISGVDYWTGDETIDYIGYNSMYCGSNGVKVDFIMELASPSCLYSNVNCEIFTNKASLNYGSGPDRLGKCIPLLSNLYYFSPTVSLLKDFELEIEV